MTVYERMQVAVRPYEQILRRVDDPAYLRCCHADNKLNLLASFDTRTRFTEVWEAFGSLLDE